MFVHTLSTTKPISFSDQLHASSLTLELTQTTEKRSKLQQLLKSIKDEKVKQTSTGKSKDEDAPPLLTQKDWLKVVQAAEDYMPMVYAIDRCLRTDDILMNGELVFNWKETLTASTNKTPLPGIQGELVHVLLLNGKATCNLAATLVASVGNYEITEAAILSEDERKKKEERLKFGADLLCRAAGMFEFAGNDLMKEWENEVGLARLSQLGRSAESTREMCTALARLSQAEAELLAIRKLLSPTNCYQTATRTFAPPLPSSHPSPSLLSKLYLNAASQFESALSLAQTACNAIGVRSDDSTAPGGSASEDLKLAASSGFKARLVSKLGSSRGKLMEESTRSGKLSVGFVKYLTKSIFASQARAYVWLGVDKGERGQYGEAISFLRLAKEEIEGISSGNKISLHPKDDRKKDEKRKFTQERESVLKLIADWTKAYTQLNDTVGFQPIPPTSSLSSQIPAGRGATASKPYKLPVPAFGPGSVGFVSEGMQRWKGMSDGDSNGELGGQGSDGNAVEEEYAGQGAYY
ncbi:uncharacterized protein FA14DRAFT_173166 [Meira miltonrushii]|uniref:pH-response regulator protein palC n=1 Tax=Meira miltonrushii TaxID=1280837 RepID=A0A316V6X5_9BASI|nr:uncharacterized protein FA14DRAFT_173166 [Meira miltonrushii]PWN33359.1 hypothetical protein FA14DRAFT_173166 [Meira miltonrushii]